MPITIPKRDSRMVLLLLLYGLIVMVWMSFEDNGSLSVTLLGTGAAIVFVGDAIWQRLSGNRLVFRQWFVGVVALGALIGAMAIILTVVLMFFKNSWHGHIHPDYPPPMMLAMLTRVPMWMLSGGLVGFGVALIQLAIPHPNSDSTVVE